MATYIILGRFTRQGIATIKNSGARLDASRQMLQEMGVEIKAFYLTMGHYDTVVIAEAPDDETAIKGLIATGLQGNISTETLRAFDEDKYREIINTLP